MHARLETNKNDAMVKHVNNIIVNIFQFL